MEWSGKMFEMKMERGKGRVKLPSVLVEDRQVLFGKETFL